MSNTGGAQAPSSVVVVGSGAREHALARVLARNARVTVTPGNPGIAAISAAETARGGPPIEVTATPPEELDGDLFVIGPEPPLVEGLADRLRAQGKTVFGPGADGARLEGSKAWMKQVLSAAGVPTAAFASFDQADEAIEYLRSLAAPWVVKTDGLAAGKGVLVTDDRSAAEADVRDKLAGRSFGQAGTRVVIEEGLVGQELSIMAVCDGRRAVAFTPARDFKRLGDRDTGPNTGGMGSFSPVPEVDHLLVEEIMATCVQPTLEALAARGIDYRGVLYAGLMLTAAGPRIIEFNVRFGDPETQVILERFEGDLGAFLLGAATGTLDAADQPRFSDEPAVCVVLAADGYPEAPIKGDLIEGIDQALATGATVLAAGVGGNSQHPVTAGGRVLSVVARGADLASARDAAYQAADRISWPGLVKRSDIAQAATEGAI